MSWFETSLQVENFTSQQRQVLISETLIEKKAQAKLRVLKAGDLLVKAPTKNQTKRRHSIYLVLKDRLPEELFVSVYNIDLKQKEELNITWKFLQRYRVEKPV